MRSAARLLRQYSALVDEDLARLAQAKWKCSDGQMIWKRFAMPSHTEAAEFALRVAKLSDRLNHHSEIRIKYRYVTFELRTNDVDGLSNYDAELAHEIDKLKTPSST